MIVFILCIYNFREVCRVVYRDMLDVRFDTEVGRVVGCGLDRLERAVSHGEIQLAVKYFKENRRNSLGCR